ncbi:unnamed protein product [Toxocara canis]|uniref:DUF3577 domain-containing protein n=1 Tax=Toxocara canis TaxID=6265 RepID=A0A183V3W9_TOXCA|nr:unnamed protein product [Toxocara canis]
MKFVEAVAFNIARPRGASFGATPHIGMVRPSEQVTIYCTFKSERISRVPDDGIYVYTTFQQEIPDSFLAGANTPKENERLARKVWSKFEGECRKCLRLGVVFEGKRAVVHEKHVEIIADLAPASKGEKQEELHSSQLPSANEDV